MMKAGNWELGMGNGNGASREVVVLAAFPYRKGSGACARRFADSPFPIPHSLLAEQAHV